ncbi:hypothetical protein GCM10009774_23010 [Cellulomonas gelida]|uniref:Uncharacterized protein n=1 Tax=Cellulomonas gelida TaxID=1712 RepID=A0A4Y3KID6_9CELL|nr:hypothetical protein CGE01nite_10130 [Cellulomonas gelida]GGL31902.1 hypothetical protein GCM10009774_23010 [Cellulomonas gelida]
MPHPGTSTPPWWAAAGLTMIERRRAAVAPGSIFSRFERPCAERRSRSGVALPSVPPVSQESAHGHPVSLSPCVHAVDAPRFRNRRPGTNLSPTYLPSSGA